MAFRLILRFGFDSWRKTREKVRGNGEQEKSNKTEPIQSNGKGNSIRLVWAECVTWSNQRGETRTSMSLKNSCWIYWIFHYKTFHHACECVMCVCRFIHWAKLPEYVSVDCVATHRLYTQATVRPNIGFVSVADYKSILLINSIINKHPIQTFKPDEQIFIATSNPVHVQNRRVAYGW